MMDADKKKALAVDLKKAKTERQMCGFLDKAGNEQIKALFDKWKVKVEDDESYHLIELILISRFNVKCVMGENSVGHQLINSQQSSTAKY